MGNRIAIERRPVPLAAILEDGGKNLSWGQTRGGTSGDPSTSSGSEGIIITMMNGGNGTDDPGSRINNKVKKGGSGVGGGSGYNSSLHVWRFFADAGDPQVVHNEAVNLGAQSFASFDKHQVYLALHIFSEDARKMARMRCGSSATMMSQKMANGESATNDAADAFGKTSVDSLLASSVEAFTPRGLASCLQEAFISSSDGTNGTSSTILADGSSPSSSMTPAGAMDDNGDAVTGNSPVTGLAPDDDDEEGGGSGPLAFNMYVWRGKESPRIAQALALTKSFELEKALKKNGRIVLRQLFQGGDKMPFSSRFVDNHNNHELHTSTSELQTTAPSAPRTTNQFTSGEEDGLSEDDSGSDEGDVGSYSRQNHLYGQLLKRRRIARRNTASGTGEAGENPSRKDSGSNGSVPKLSLQRVKNLFQAPVSPSHHDRRSLSADSLQEIINAAKQDLAAPQPTSAVSARAADEFEDSTETIVTDDSSTSSSSTSPSSSSSSFSSSSSSFSSSTAATTGSVTPPRSSSKSAPSATIPSPSTPPLSHKKLKAKFKLPPFRTENASKSAPVQAIPTISSFKLSDLQSLQAEENDSGDPFKESEVKLRGDKLKKYDGICSKITDQLYLGSQTVSKDLDMLKQQGVTHILNCAGSICPEYYPDLFCYRTLYLMDGVREDITCMLYDIIEWMDNVINSNGKILVHCQQGVSRSSAMMIGYLMWKYGWDFERTHMFVKERRGVSSPNPGFICQLLYLAKRLAIARSGNDPETRLYQIVTHSRHDPDFIVAKLAKKESVTELEDPTPSPSCYIVQSPEAFFVWVGSQCNKRFVEVAERTVRRIQHFENATQNVTIVEQGKESEDFRRHLKSVT